MYYLWSARAGGWMTKVSNYSTDVKEAQAFAREEALAMCKLQKERGNYQLLPIAISDLEAI